MMGKLIIEKLDKAEIKNQGIENWPIWEKEISKFDWTYDTDEKCLILEGEVDVETPEGIFRVRKGDFVIFKQGLTCVWDIKKPIKKHYRFD